MKALTARQQEVFDLIRDHISQTGMPPTRAEMAQGLDLLLAECGFTEVEQTRGIHLTGGRAGVLAREGGVGQLVLTHIQPWTDPEVPLSEAQSQFDGQTEVALAGSTWVL